MDSATGSTGAGELGAVNAELAASADAGTEVSEAPELNGDGTPNEQPNKAETKPQPPAKRKYEFEVEGKKETEELDDDEIKARLQKARGADKKFNEADKRFKDAERFYQLMLENPQAVMEKIHGSKKWRDMQEQALWQQIQREQMDPKDRELEDLRSWKAEQEDRRKQEEEERKRSEMEAKKKEYSERFNKEVLEALKSSGYENTEYMTRRAAHYLLSALPKNPNVGPKDVMEFVKSDLQKDLKAYTGSLNEDNVIEQLGDAVAELIRKADLKRVKGGNAPKPAEEPAKKKKEKEDSFPSRSKSIFEY